MDKWFDGANQLKDAIAKLKAAFGKKRPTSNPVKPAQEKPDLKKSDSKKPDEEEVEKPDDDGDLPDSKEAAPEDVEAKEEKPVVTLKPVAPAVKKTARDSMKGRT